MPSDITQFIALLKETGNNPKSQLNMIILRVSAVKTNYQFASEQNKPRYHILLQELVNLFVHIYEKRSLNDFLDLMAFDDMW